MTPRVLRIITRLNVGGPATHVTLLDRGLSDLGWQTLLLHGDVEPTEVEFDLAGVSIPRRRIQSLRRPIDPVADARAFASIVAAIRETRPHVIHTHLSKAGLLGRAAAIAMSRAVRIHTFHGTLFGDYFGATATKAIVRAEQSLGHRTHRVVALSELQRTELLDHRIAAPERIRVVPLGLDLARFRGLDRRSARVRLGIADDVVLIAALGRLVPVKRLDRLIGAFAEVHAAVPTTRLAIVGDGSERLALEAVAAASGHREAIDFVGWAVEPPDWYAAVDIVCLTSDREGTPLALIEAAAASRVVVATDAGGVADVVEDGQTGFVVGRDDEGGLRERLRLLAGDATMRTEMGTRAASRVERFAVERLVADMDRLYREALAERRTTRR